MSNMGRFKVVYERCVSYCLKTILKSKTEAQKVIDTTPVQGTNYAVTHLAAMHVRRRCSAAKPCK